MRELLEELVARSNGKLTLKVIDPQPFSEEEDRANELGMQPVADQRRAAKSCYLGLAATNSTDGKESIPYLDPQLDEQLEYDVAKLIHKLSSAKKPVVGWLSSLPMQGDFDMQTGRPRPPWVVYGQIEQLYTVRNLEPTLTKHRRRRRRAGAGASEGPAARGAVRHRPVRDARRPRAGVRRSELRRPTSPAQDPNNPMAQFTADKSSHLEPLLAAWGVDFKPDQVVVDLERGLVVAMREGEPPLAAHRHPGPRRLEHGQGRDHRAARQHQHGHRR